MSGGLNIPTAVTAALYAAIVIVAVVVGFFVVVEAVNRWGCCYCLVSRLMS